MKKILLFFIIFLNSFFSSAQCTYPGGTAVNTYSFCIDNSNTITTANVTAGQYVVLNVISGFNYTFSVGDINNAENENLTIFNGVTNAFLTGGYNSGATAATINWTSTLSGQIKILFSRGACVNSGGNSGAISLRLNSIGNNLDSQTTFGTNQWVGHVYNHTDGPPPGGSTSPTSPSTTTSPFISSNYVGYYTIPTETIDESFGGNTACFPVLSNGVVRTNIYTELFSVRYRMRSTRAAGCYFLNVNGDDGVRVYVDNVLVFNQWRQQGNTVYCNNLIYLNGDSDIILDYYEHQGGNVVGFSLTPFDGSGNVITSSSDVRVCSGVSPGLIDGAAFGTCTGGANGGTNTIYQWQISSDNVVFSDISGATSEDYTPTTVSTTTSSNIRYYRRVLKASASNAGSCSFNSNVVKVTTSQSARTFAVSPGSSSCSKTDVTYTTQPGMTNYIWTVPGTLGTDYTITSGGIGTGSNSVVLKWLTSGSKTVTVNYTSSCSGATAAASSTTSVVLSPNNVVNGFTGGTICNGSTGILTFDADDTGFSGPYTVVYTDGATNWSTSIATAAATSFNVAVNPIVTTNYSLVSITSATGCVTIADFTNATARITVRALPAATISGTTTVCQNASSPSITFTNPQASAITVTYNINGGANLTSNIGASTAATVLVPTGNTGGFTYNLTSVVYQSNPTCTTIIAGNSATVTVRSILTPTAAITNTNCMGTSGVINIDNLSTAIEFKNSNNDYVDLGSSFLSNRGSFTVEGWVNFSKASVVNRMSLFGQNDVVEFGFMNATTFDCWTPNGGSVSVALPASLGNNNWHHIAAVGNGTNLKLYIDGVNVATGGSGTSNYGSSAFSAKIGGGVIDNTGGSFTGQIMKVGMYSTALDATQISNLSKDFTTYTGSEPSLLAGYNFFEGKGTTLASLPSTANGTFMNSPVWKEYYTYSWTKTGVPTFSSTSKNITGLSTGQYNLTVSLPALSCSTIQSFTMDPTVTSWNGAAWSNGIPTSDKSIVFSSLYPNTINVDLEGCSCTVANGVNVTIKTGRFMRIQNEVVINGSGTLTFEDKASLIQVNDVPTNPNSGNIIYKRLTNMIDKFDYTYWSSPVKNQKLIDVSPTTLGDKFLSFDSDVNNWKYEDAYNTNMIAGKGYIIRGPQAYYAPNPPNFYLASFIGEPINGVVSTAIKGTNVSNLIGNPYPSALSANAFLAANSSVLDGTIYFWTHNTHIGIGVSNPGSGTYAYSSDDYASYNLTGGTGTQAISGGNTPSGVIAAGQSFFATSVNPGNAIFNNAMRTKAGTIMSNSQFFKPGSSSKKTDTFENNRIWLNLTNDQGAFKQTLVGYVTGATNDYERAYDGASFNANSYVNFYSLQDDLGLAIQGRALPFDENDTVPLGYESNIAGNFNIAIDQVDGLFTGQTVFLEDKFLNVIHNLKETPYSFATAIGVFDDRFVLSYTNKTLGKDDFQLEENKVVISNRNNEIKITSPINEIVKVFIYDIAGRQIFMKSKVDKNELIITSLLSSNQVLVVKVMLQNKEIVTRKIIY